MTHSVIPPSSAHIWAPRMGCPGWRRVNQERPETERNIVADEGTAAHELAARMISSMARVRTGFPRREDTVGTEAPNGVIYTDEIYDGALVYAEYAETLMKCTKNFNPGIERPVHSTAHPELFGTVDFDLYDREHQNLHVMDLKFGFGPVEAFENWQLMTYAMCLVEMLEVPKTANVILNIIQPRRPGFNRRPDQWRTTVYELQPFFDQIVMGAYAAAADDAIVRSGRHCRYCVGRFTCPAALQAGLNLYEATCENVSLDDDVSSVAARYALLDRLREHINAVALGYEEQLLAEAKRGRSIPGFIVAPSSGRTVWSKPTEEILTLGEMLGIDLRKKDPITPRQAKEAGVSDDLLKSFTERKIGALKLTRDDGREARKVFGS